MTWKLAGVARVVGLLAGLLAGLLVAPVASAQGTSAADHGPALAPVPDYVLDADVYLPGKTTALWLSGSLLFAGSMGMVAWGNFERDERDEALAACEDSGFVCDPQKRLDRATGARYGALVAGLGSLALLTTAIVRTIRRRHARRRLRERALRTSLTLDPVLFAMPGRTTLGLVGRF